MDAIVARCDGGKFPVLTHSLSHEGIASNVSSVSRSAEEAYCMPGYRQSRCGVVKRSLPLLDSTRPTVQVDG